MASLAQFHPGALVVAPPFPPAENADSTRDTDTAPLDNADGGEPPRFQALPVAWYRDLLADMQTGDGGDAPEVAEESDGNAALGKECDAVAACVTRALAWEWEGLGRRQQIDWLRHFHVPSSTNSSTSLPASDHKRPSVAPRPTPVASAIAQVAADTPPRVMTHANTCLQIKRRLAMQVGLLYTPSTPPADHQASPTSALASTTVAHVDAAVARLGEKIQGIAGYDVSWVARWHTAGGWTVFAKHVVGVATGAGQATTDVGVGAAPHAEMTALKEAVLAAVRAHFEGVPHYPTVAANALLALGGVVAAIDMHAGHFDWLQALYASIVVLATGTAGRGSCTKSPTLFKMPRHGCGPDIRFAATVCRAQIVSAMCGYGAVAERFLWETLDASTHGLDSGAADGLASTGSAGAVTLGHGMALATLLPDALRVRECAVHQCFFNLHGVGNLLHNRRQRLVAARALLLNPYHDTDGC